MAHKTITAQFKEGMEPILKSAGVGASSLRVEATHPDLLFFAKAVVKVVLTVGKAKNYRYFTSHISNENISKLSMYDVPSFYNFRTLRKIYYRIV